MMWISPFGQFTEHHVAVEVFGDTSIPEAGIILVDNCVYRCQGTCEGYTTDSHYTFWIHGTDCAQIRASKPKPEYLHILVIYIAFVLFVISCCMGECVKKQYKKEEDEAIVKCV